MRDINTVLNNFIKSQNYNDVKACYSPLEDSYYIPNNIDMIVLGGITNREADKVFLDLCYTKFGLKVKDLCIETLSFLHELGHYLTMDYLSDNELFNSEMVKMTLYMTKDEGEYDYEDYELYMTCPIEYEATAAAVEFCNNNSEVVKTLNKDILKALYERN